MRASVGCWPGRGWTPRGGRCLVLGSGGAAVTVRAVLTALGAAEVVTISRRGPDHYGNLARHADAGLIVNATPVGMYPDSDAAPLSLEGFPALAGVADLIYNPGRTRLLQQAEALGIPHAGGLSMLAAQARRAAELFTGRDIPDAALEAALAAVEGQSRNISIIGMPGAGKTTTGRRLAAALGRPFLDMDEELRRRTGRSSAEIIRADGEDAFRRAETALLADVGRRSGIVLATGGGVVTRPENYFHLRQNSRVVFLNRRDIDALPTAGRPLSQARSPRALARERLPLYRSWCDLEVDAIGPEATVAQLRKELGL